MDHFESIISTLLEADHYWVRRSFKIGVTPEEKRLVHKRSIPRPEIDLLALSFSKNEVIAFEAKSFLDSPGVSSRICKWNTKCKRGCTSSSLAKLIERLF